MVLAMLNDEVVCKYIADMAPPMKKPVFAYTCAGKVVAYELL